MFRFARKLLGVALDKKRARGGVPCQDAAPALLPLLPAGVEDGGVQGLEEVRQSAHLPLQPEQNLKTEVQQLGAVHVAELAQGDWERLPTWPTLLEMQKRRLLAAARAASNT